MTMTPCSRMKIPAAYCSCSLHDRIGGTLDYSKLAQRHRPTDQAGLAAAARDMAARGLTERDIGQALQLDATAVRALLQRLPVQPGATDEAARLHAEAWSAQRGQR